jgi:aspartate-semialdehyde dehydrogenase
VDRDKKIRVGVLGATGWVGQQYVSLLENHPFFELTFLAASPDSKGKTYGQVLCEKGLSFRENTFNSYPIFGVEEVQRAQESCDLVFSAISGPQAKDQECAYAEAGFAVVSNTSAHRLESDIPLIIPEINSDHLTIIPFQQKKRGWKRGFIVAKPNCSLQSFLIPLFPLHQVAGVRKLSITTLQAISGAGYPGVSSLDIIDNVIPYIGGEEEKTEKEPLKILGTIQEGAIFSLDSLKISAHCNRVPVLDGHTVCVSVELEKTMSQEEILFHWRTFQSKPQSLRLPSAPTSPILYREERDRPQPRWDRDAGDGMSVTVGRLRPCPLFDYRFTGLSHNTLRGAAKGAILNAELLKAEGYLSFIK